MQYNHTSTKYVGRRWGFQLRHLTLTYVALWRKTRIPPIYATAPTPRARAMAKTQVLTTYIGTVIPIPYCGRKWTRSAGVLIGFSRGGGEQGVTLRPDRFS